MAMKHRKLKTGVKRVLISLKECVKNGRQTLDMHSMDE